KECECLRWYGTKVNISLIKSYTIQEETDCSVRVIKFQTVRGKTICSDPNNNWTIRAMKTLDLQKSAMVERQNITTESGIAPTKSALTRGPSTHHTSPTPSTSPTPKHSIFTPTPTEAHKKKKKIGPPSPYLAAHYFHTSQSLTDGEREREIG
uniref:Chemokine interleukin-8-like domain-containing protein n=1 Tax=Oryzias sinensis TaxID=183150 RepID=A0A8C7WV36_9TELE